MASVTTTACANFRKASDAKIAAQAAALVALEKRVTALELPLPPPPPPPPPPPNEWTLITADATKLVTGATWTRTIFRPPLYGLVGAGIAGATLTDVRFEGNAAVNMDGFGMKIGSGAQSTGIVATNIVAVNVDQMFYANLSDSVFRNMSIQVPVDTNGKNHALYLERGNHGLSFFGLTLTGGCGQAVHLYCEAGWTGGGSDILFDGLDVTTPVSQPVVIGDYYERVTIKNAVLRATAPGQSVFNFRRCRDVVVDGFEAWGTGPLVVCPYPAEALRITVKNGIYHGPSLGSAPGVTFENVTLVPGEHVGCSSG